MTNDASLHPDDELLTAFLDRELSNEDRRLVEMRLARTNRFEEDWPDCSKHGYAGLSPRKHRQSQSHSQHP